MGAEILAGRWNILIIRELLMGNQRFNDIHRGLPGLSRTLLSQRLRFLQHHGLIEPLAKSDPGTGTGGGYRLTEAGAELDCVLKALGCWAVRWRFPEPRDDQLNPHLLLWRMRSSLVPECLPGRRIVVEFVFEDRRIERGWLIVNGEDSSVCIQDPMLGIDLYARGPSRLWHEIFNGHRLLTESIDDGQIVVCGENDLTTQFPTWIEPTYFAEYVRAQHAADQSRETLRG